MVCLSRSVCTAFALVLLNTTSCTGKQPTTTIATAEPKTEDQNPESPTKPTKVVEIKNDLTLYPDEYEARGVPSIQNPWTANDYQIAIPALLTLAKEDLNLLPRIHSPRSGSVFRRMVSRDNLQIYANRDIEWAIRNSSLIALVGSYPAISAPYVEALSQGIQVDREILEIMAFIGLISAAMWESLDEVEPLIYRNDPGLPKRLAGVQETQQGAGGIVRGMITILHDRQFVRLDNHVWYTAELVNLLPRLIGRLTPADQAEAQERIIKLAASEPEPALRKQLKLLQSAVANPKTPLVPHPPNMSVGSP